MSLFSSAITKISVTKDPFLKRGVNEMTSYLVSEFLHSSPTDTFSWIILDQGSVLCLLGAYTLNAHRIPSVATTKNITRHCHMFSLEGEGRLPPMKISALLPSRTILSCPHLLQKLMSPLILKITDCSHNTPIRGILGKPTSLQPGLEISGLIRLILGTTVMFIVQFASQKGL